ncbi:hypothetical protein GPX89_09090 [Nocardia sp. ET3-3]|uniref:Uncharacterized protein n=1 Tax=Nocardia terrae TaxID=2675851 RepID=A0A7K1USZ7_9NOCA|nr:hypothetical protein [Nocardia terrae]MVU77401.1 hypothetical protein [Nocardia terrae]
MHFYALCNDIFALSRVRDPLAATDPPISIRQYPYPTDKEARLNTIHDDITAIEEVISIVSTHHSLVEEPEYERIILSLAKFRREMTMRLDPASGPGPTRPSTAANYR